MSTGAGRVTSEMTISADGYAAGVNQTEQRPFGEDGGDGWADKLHGWYNDDDAASPDVDQAAAPGAFIMGRNMFGPIRGEWDRPWTGWWGDNPPYHVPVFVLTHHAREPQPMEGGTTFYFVTDGIESALKQAREAAGDRDISVQGGAATVNQYLAAGHIDELRLHIAPMLLGGGSRLFDGVPLQHMEQVESRTGKNVIHVTYRVRKEG